jgi:hypothetical protein
MRLDKIKTPKFLNRNIFINYALIFLFLSSFYVSNNKQGIKIFSKVFAEVPASIEIYTIEDLDNIRGDLTGTYLLMNDLDFNDCASYEDCGNKDSYTTGLGWDPIGYWVSDEEHYPFEGTFNGQSHEIKNLFINRAYDDEQGLFGYNTGTIKNIGTVDVNITNTGDDLVGGLVGSNEGTVENSYSTGSVTGGEDGIVGGLVGDNNGGTIESSYSNVTVTGDVLNSIAGGLVGAMGSLDTVIKSYATGSVSGNGDIGGLVGWNNGGTIENSYSTGSVTGEGEALGGLVGYNGYDSPGTITNSYSTGSVTGEGDVVIIGGLVGIDDGVSTIENSFWDMEISGVSISDGGTGKTTEQMHSILTFNNTETEGLHTPWDIIEMNSFNSDSPTIWYIDDLNDYPHLYWEFIEEESIPKTVSEKDTKCRYNRPQKTTWIRLEPTTKGGILGMNITWVQYSADKVNIKIDDGTNAYPWKISNTPNDGHEFLPNVTSYQNIMIQPINHCKSGSYGIPVSYSLYPSGWYSTN